MIMQLYNITLYLEDFTFYKIVQFYVFIHANDISSAHDTKKNQQTTKMHIEYYGVFIS